MGYEDGKMSRRAHAARRAAALLIICLYAPPASAYRAGGADISCETVLVETFDDNISSVKDNPRSDFITGFNCALKAAYEGRNSAARLTARITPEFFTRYSRFNNVAEGLTAEGSYDFSRHDRLSFREDFIHAEEPPGFEDEFGRASGRYAYLRNRFDIAYLRQITRQFSLSGRYAHDAYAPSGGGLSDSLQNAVGLSGEYTLNSMTVLSAAGDFSRRRFRPGSHAERRAVSGGIRRFFTSQLYADARAGVDFISSYDGSRQTAPFFEAAVTDEVDKNTDARLSFIRRHDTNSYTSDIFDNWRLSLFLQRRLLPRTGVSLTAFFGRGAYTRLGIKDEDRGVSVSLRYDVRENAAVTIGYGFSRVNSNFDNREYTRNRITAGISLIF